ncbi:MAG: hypothetical protein WDN46_10455 [Methylocella sp.]
MSYAPAAVLLPGAALAAVAAPSPDPIFALIEAHRVANVDLKAAEGSPDDAAYEVIYAREGEAQKRLFATNATTIAGVEAFAAHIVKYPRIVDFEHPDFSLTKALTTIAAALHEIRVTPHAVRVA